MTNPITVKDFDTGWWLYTTSDVFLDIDKLDELFNKENKETRLWKNNGDDLHYWEKDKDFPCVEYRGINIENLSLVEVLDAINEIRLSNGITTEAVFTATPYMGGQYESYGVPGTLIITFGDNCYQIVDPLNPERYQKRE